GRPGRRRAQAARARGRAGRRLAIAGASAAGARRPDADGRGRRTLSRAGVRRRAGEAGDAAFAIVRRAAGRAPRGEGALAAEGVAAAAHEDAPDAGTRFAARWNPRFGHDAPFRPAGLPGRASGGSAAPAAVRSSSAESASAGEEAPLG